MSIDYDLDGSLTDNSSTHKISVGEHQRKRRSLTQKTTLKRSREEEEEYERFVEQREQIFFEDEEDHNGRYRHKRLCAKNCKL